MVMNEMAVGDLHVWWREIRRLTVEMNRKVEMNEVKIDEKVEIDGEGFYLVDGQKLGGWR